MSNKGKLSCQLYKYLVYINSFGIRTFKDGIRESKRLYVIMFITLSAIPNKMFIKAIEISETVVKYIDIK